MFSCGPLHMDKQVLDVQLEHIYNSSVQKQDVVWRTCRKQRMIEMIGERESGKSMQVTRHDDDDEVNSNNNNNNL